tara:strand:+ start:701 stop:862 length:162 start_codon:yes stop_codon:yes gene_type:complete
MSKKKKDKVKVPKQRNFIAIAAHFRTGAGSHGDDKKQTSKTKCRGKVSTKDWD